MKAPAMKIKANGIDINYQIDGPEGAPWLVFSNSLATSTAMWDEQVAALKDKFRVLRYDQRGHGGTQAPAGRYPFDTLLDDALGFIVAGMRLAGQHELHGLRAGQQRECPVGIMGEQPQPLIGRVASREPDRQRAGIKHPPFTETYPTVTKSSQIRPGCVTKSAQDWFGGPPSRPAHGSPQGSGGSHEPRRAHPV